MGGTELALFFAPCAHRSGEQLLDDACRLNPGEALIQALESVAEPTVVETEQLQNGRVEVTDVYGIGGSRLVDGRN